MADFGVCYRYDNRLDIMNQWEFVLSNFGLMSGEVWVRGAPAEFESYLKAVHIDKADEIPGDRPLVLLAHTESKVPGLISLVDYVHPVNAIYVFGADNVVFTEEDDIGTKTLDAKVYIPTAQYECYAHIAAAMTFYDRMAKGG